MDAGPSPKGPPPGLRFIFLKGYGNRCIVHLWACHRVVDRTKWGSQVPCRILIADDHEVVRRGVYAILRESRPAWEICGEAANGQEAVQAVAALQPDVVILDITMPVMNGFEAASRIARLNLACRVLLFTMHESESLIADIRSAGAQGYVQKSRAARDLIVAIETLLTGGTFFGSITKEKPRGNDEPNPDVAFFRALPIT